jgi:para-nitrobenzyl esterase
MASPLTKGLFTRAIGESGGALTTIAAFGPKPLQIGEQDGIKFIEAMGMNSIAELRAKSAQEILEAGIKSPITYAFGVVDGYVVPEHPASIYAEGKQNDVPLLVGWNADEGSLFAARIPLPADAPPYAERIRAQFKDQADTALKLYVFDNENAGARRPGLQLTQRTRSRPRQGCGGCAGDCGGGGPTCCASCASSGGPDGS